MAFGIRTKIGSSKLVNVQQADWLSLMIRIALSVSMGINDKGKTWEGNSYS